MSYTYHILFQEMGTSIQEYRARIGTFQHGDNLKSRNRKIVVLQGSSNGFSTLFPSLMICAFLLIISGVEKNPGPDYVCKECSFICTSVEKYFQHQKDSHAMIPCMYSECSFKTPALSPFKVHVWTCHPSMNVLQKESYSCPVPACKVTCSHSFQDHLEKHLAIGNEFTCPFSEECKVIHRSRAAFRTHLSQYH